MRGDQLLMDKSYLRYRYGWHALFWLAYYLYDGPVFSLIEEVPTSRLAGAAIQLPVKMAATYFTLYALLPVYLRSRRHGNFFLYLFASMLFFGMLQRTISYTLTYPIFFPQSLNRPLWYPPKIIIEIFGTYSVVAIAGTIHLVKRWYLNQQANLLLQREKLEAELKFLQSQVHPHFLFNTLNNLYTLTLTDPQKAPDIVYKLAQLMSYMLHESNQPTVPLEKEIEYIEHYITLEKIRYGDRLDVSLNVLEEMDGIRIAPLLILPFVENSFKHGFSNQIGRVWVRLDLLVKDDTLVIKVENSRNPAPARFGNRTPHVGIGLKNVRRRLDLIYPQRHDLQVFEEEETFLVVLKLQLPSRTIPQAYAV